MLLWIYRKKIKEQMDQRILVLKFGGTSVKDIAAMNKAATLSLEHDFDHVLVVSSAISGVTNMLVYIADQLKAGNYDIEDKVGEVIDLHTRMGQQLQSSGFEMEKINQHLQAFKNLVEKTRRSKNITKSEYARFPSFGELLSTTLLAHIIQQKEKSAIWFDVRSILKTDDNYLGIKKFQNLTEFKNL